MQILAEFRAVGEGSPVTFACAYGGVSKMRQLVDISQGVDILIATPGRLLEYLGASQASVPVVDVLLTLPADADSRRIGHRMLISQSPAFRSSADDLASMRQLKRVTYLVVDEADRMIHEGFEEELRQIFSCVRPDRQVLMCAFSSSLTLPPPRCLYPLFTLLFARSPVARLSLLPFLVLY